MYNSFIVKFTFLVYLKNKIKIRIWVWKYRKAKMSISNSRISRICRELEKPITKMRTVCSILAWEPSAAQVTKSYFRRSPALKRFYRGNNFRYKSWSTQLRISKPRTFPWVSWVLQSKFEANRSRGSWVMIGKTTNKQTEISTLYIYI